ncbi:hypothetical protein Tco_0079681 [Tanacetum coccineum]
MTDPASHDHMHASPYHAPALPDHIPGSPELVAASLDHVFAFPDDDLVLDIEEDPEKDEDMDIDKEDHEEDPKEDQEMDLENEDDEPPELVASSPNHVFAFPDDDLVLDIEEDPEEDEDMDINEEDPKEGQEMDLEDEDDEWEDDDDWLMAPVKPPRAASQTRPDTPPLPSSIPAPLPIDPFMLPDY